MWILTVFLAVPAIGKTLVFSAVEDAITVETARRVLERAYQKIEISIEIRELPGTRGLFYSNAGQTDGEAFRVEEIEKSYTNLCRIEVPIFTNCLYLFVKKGREFSVDGWASIPPDCRVGFQRGVQIIEKNTQAHQIKTERARHADQLFTMLKYDRVDAVIAGGDQFARQGGKLERDNIIQLRPPVHSHPLYHYLHISHADLIPQITEVLREMLADGELQRIQKEVEAEQHPQGFRSGAEMNHECKAR
jgi:polar amino acid transport system substrate-binding protein